MSDNVDSESSTAPPNGVQDSEGNLPEDVNSTVDPQTAVSEEKKPESSEQVESTDDMLTPVSTAGVHEENSSSELNDDVKSEPSFPAEVETPNGKAPVVNDTLKDEPKSAQIDGKLEKSEEKESLIDDSSASKENIDKSNTLSCALSDDLIFVKPKDKDRGHCYWYSILFLSQVIYVIFM